jgi:cold shock CspA family protein
MQLTNNRGQLVKWLKNFGFIKCEDRSVFVHRDNYLSGFLPEVGQIVLFDFGLSPNPNQPPQAVKVRVVKSATAVRADEAIKAGLLALQGGAA